MDILYYRGVQEHCNWYSCVSVCSLYQESLLESLYSLEPQHHSSVKVYVRVNIAARAKSDQATPRGEEGEGLDGHGDGTRTIIMAKSARWVAVLSGSPPPVQSPQPLGSWSSPSPAMVVAVPVKRIPMEKASFLPLKSVSMSGFTRDDLRMDADRTRVLPAVHQERVDMELAKRAEQEKKKRARKAARAEA